MRALQFGASRVLDLAPLPQLFAIALLSWTGVLVARRFAIVSPVMAALLTLPLGAQPFVLENLSYRFDAPFMALALPCALLPIVIKRAGKAGWGLGTFSLIACLNLYQPAITAFLVVALLEAAVADTADLRSHRQTIGACLAVRGRGDDLSIAVRAFIQRAARATRHARRSRNGARVVAENLNVFVRFVVESSHPALFAFFTILVILALAALVVAGASRAMSGHHARPHWQTTLFALALLALACVALINVAGPMLLLRDPTRAHAVRRRRSFAKATSSSA